ncbi:MAG: molybdate ABC transporter permease subunit [Acidimicrobiales bacterium]|jgi:molybdate transport system permease protein
MNHVPKTVRILGLIGAALIILPLLGLVSRAPWTQLWSIASTGSVRSAIFLTAVTSIITTCIAVGVGVPLAIVLSERSDGWRRILRALVTLPIVLPPVAGGIALLAAFGRRGVLGRLLEQWFGITLLGTPAAVVIAQLFVSLPFLVVAVDSALQNRDRKIEEAAATLGSSPGRTLRLVTLPGIRPAIVAGATLAWARAVGELGATLTFAGSFPGRTRTVPSSILLLLETDPEAARALAAVLLIVAAAVLIGLRQRWMGVGGYWSSSATSRDR